MIVLFGSTRAPLVWEEEKDVLCCVYDKVAKAARGNLWARRQAFLQTVLQSASFEILSVTQHKNEQLFQKNPPNLR